MLSVKSIAIILSLCVIAAIYFIFDPTSSPLFPKCPLLMLTGLECPGCGSQRAIHAMLNARFTEALRTNPLVVVYTPYMIITLSALFFKNKTKKAEHLYAKLTSTKVAWFSFVLFVSFGILRNLV